MKNIQRQQLIDRIKALDGLTDDERSALLGLLREQKTYGLVWEDKPEAVEERLQEELPVLTEVRDRAIISDDPDAPDHILIEGDNLEALTTLAYTHEGRIDVIYIDPPYNTGNRDFVYNDSFVDTEDTYRHSKWLSFMSRRLRIAKKLLSDRGVIFISIDDNELAGLKLLCDEIFGSQNFIDYFSWNKTETPANLSLKTKKAIEYVLCYCKQRNSEKFRGLSKTSTSNNGLMNQTNSEHILVFPKNVVDTKLPDGIYSKGVYGTKSYYIELLEDTEVKNGFFILPVVLKGKFKWGQRNLESEIAKGTKVSIKTKAFSPSYEKAEYDPEVPWNLIDRTFGVDTNEVAGTQLKDILGPNVFDFPKPVSLIKYLINFIDSSTILDFFAGSGTTLHAVMQLNAEDGGKRQCILCTNNENGICENVTYERNKRVINGYTKPNGDRVEGLHDNNLRYYRTDFVGRSRTMRNMHRLVNLSTDMLCIKENLYTEQPAMGGVRTHPQVFRYFAAYDTPTPAATDAPHTDNVRTHEPCVPTTDPTDTATDTADNVRTHGSCVHTTDATDPAANVGTHGSCVQPSRHMLVIYREEYIPQIVEVIGRMDFKQPMKVYVFSPSEDPATELFEAVADKVEPTALPAAIYNTYRRILPKRKPRELWHEMTDDDNPGGLFDNDNVGTHPGASTAKEGENA